MPDMPSPAPPPVERARRRREPSRNRAARWAAPAGFSLLVVTILFLMALVVAAVMGKPVPCTGRGLVVFVMALTTGAAAGFLTGSARAEGRIPFFGGNVMQVAASGAIAAMVIVLLVGFRLYVPSDPTCSGGAGPVTLREENIALNFWTYAFARDWKPAYDLFPPVLHTQMGLPDFVTVSSQVFSQFEGPPRRRHIERATVASGNLIITTLAEFDDLSTFREFLTFQQQDNVWVPWSYVINPVEWPQANSYTFVALPAASILSSVTQTSNVNRPKLVADQYAGRFVPPPGWILVVEAVGAKVGTRTCDVNARESQSSTRVHLRHVLDGCTLTLGASIQAVGRIVTVGSGVELEAVRLWR